jgi:hypothetical protein
MKKTLVIVPLVGMALVGTALHTRVARHNERQAEMNRIRTALWAQMDVTHECDVRFNSPDRTPLDEARLTEAINSLRALSAQYQSKCAEYDCNPYTGVVR